MAVVKVQETWKGTYGVHRDSRTGLRVFTVLFDADPSSAAAATANDGVDSIPAYGATDFPGDPYLRCHDIAPDPIGPLLYLVVCSYEVRGAGGEDDPLDAPPVIEWSFTHGSEDVDQDIDDEPIQNSAGEGFDPPLQKLWGDQVLRITRNEADFDYDQALSYLYHVNSGAFLGRAAGTALFTDIRAVRVYEAATEYDRVTYEITFRTTGPKWQLHVLDQGFRYKTGKPLADGSPQLESAKVDGELATKPVLLKADGTKLPDGEDAHWLDFQVYDEADFDTLSLPTP